MGRYPCRQDPVKQEVHKTPDLLVSLKVLSIFLQISLTNIPNHGQVTKIKQWNHRMNISNISSSYQIRSPPLCPVFSKLILL